MDEAVLIMVVAKALKRVLLLITDEFMLSSNLLHNDLKQIHESLTMILAALQNTEDSMNTKRKIPIVHRLIELKGFVHDVEDALDDLAYEHVKQKVTNSNPSFQFHENVFYLQLAQKLKYVNQLLLEIKGEVLSFRGQCASSDIIAPECLDRVTDTVVGRESDISKIVNLLTLSCDQRNLTVVSIEGVDGLGKTTLAELAIGNFTKTYEIIRKLEIELARKKFLLVLDDVWSDVSSWWDGLKNLLLKICGENGNSVLVTTRFKEVSSIVETSSQHRHNIKVLSSDECWFIMKERAFRSVIAPIPSNLEVIGRDILKKCRGIPLAAKIIGGIMGFNTDEKAWLKIIDKRSLSYSHDYNGVKSLMVQSFNQLPTSLKHCFLVCSDFPEGYSIRKEELVQLWMVEGFTDSLEQGSKYLNALLENSLFQYVERSDDGDVLQCKMHDIVHQIAYSMFKYEIRAWVSPWETDAFRARHLYITHQSSIIPILVNDRTEKLCTVIVDHVPSQESWKLTSLRTISINGSYTEMSSSFIGKLKYLRYLRVSNTNIRALPESITKIYHLQTLILSASNIYTLPESISELHNLQTLNLSNSEVRELPESIGKLYHLQTLNVSDTNVNGLPKSICELQNLQILNLSNSDIKELPELISKLQNLQTLNVSYCKIKEFPESITDLCKLQTLKFLECKELSRFPRKEMNNLINLKSISFSYEHHMPFGLRHLTSLQILPFFVVGSNMGGSIEDLEYLNELRVHMEITKLEEVQDLEEAIRANLQGKKRIQGLGFQWSYGANDRNSNDEELLERLQPNPKITRLKIKYYMGEKWPSWMPRMKHPTMLCNLVDLTLEHCWNCTQLPCLGDLPYLKSLKINHMGRVKGIDNDFNFIGVNISGRKSGNLKLFPALQSLSMSWMENLMHWSSPSYNSKVVVFPSLENLSIQSCPKLTSFPFSHLSALVSIELKDCEELWFRFYEQQSFPHLKSLSIAGCPKLTYLRNWLLSKQYFREFSVRRCQWLMFIQQDLGKLHSLTSLEIYCCKRLRFFSAEILCGLTRLKHLSIGGFSEELDDFGYLNRIKELPWLEELQVWGSDFLGRETPLLPNQLQHLTALKSLKIMGFTSMEALPQWLMNLHTLKSISLNYCKSLRCQSTVPIIRRIANLECLIINCCPALEESKSEWLQSLNSKKIKVEFSHV